MCRLRYSLCIFVFKDLHAKLFPPCLWYPKHVRTTQYNNNNNKWSNYNLSFILFSAQNTRKTLDIIHHWKDHARTHIQNWWNLNLFCLFKIYINLIFLYNIHCINCIAKMEYVKIERMKLMIREFNFYMNYEHERKSNGTMWKKRKYNVNASKVMWIR